jgi:hypothetical protein
MWSMLNLCTLLAFVTGSMLTVAEFENLASGAVSKGEFLTFCFVIGSWALCYFVPLASKSKQAYHAGMSMAGSAVVIVIAALTWVLIANEGNHDPVIFGGMDFPIWVWFSLPIFFNVLLLTLSVHRYRLLHKSEVTPCPQ